MSFILEGLVFSVLTNFSEWLDNVLRNRFFRFYLVQSQRRHSTINDINTMKDCKNWNGIVQNEIKVLLVICVISTNLQKSKNS